MSGIDLDPSAARLLASLEEVARGLLFPSETDRPIVPFVLACEPTPAVLRRLAGAADDAPVEGLEVRELFAPVIESAEPAEAARYRALVDRLERGLEVLRAYRVGAVDLRLYAIGRHASGLWIGVETSAVET